MKIARAREALRIAGGILWAFNGLLGVGLVGFVILSLVFPEKRDYLKDIDKPHPAPPGHSRVDPDFSALALPNPVVRSDRRDPVARGFNARLNGTLPCLANPRNAVAFITSAARNVSLQAWVGEKILHEGRPYDEFAGWVLVEVYKDIAIFSDGNRQHILRVEHSAPTSLRVDLPAIRMIRAGQPYARSPRSGLLHSNPEGLRQLWGLDPEEIDWALQNAEAILEQDVQLSAHAGGGIKIEGVRAGSFCDANGLRAGDVVRDVNGRPLNNLSEMKSLMSHPAVRESGGLRLTVERAGKTLILEYRPAR